MFTFPWPGPGNSEGPADPDGWIEEPLVDESLAVVIDAAEAPLITTAPWPGPGDSEG